MADTPSPLPSSSTDAFGNETSSVPTMAPIATGGNGGTVGAESGTAALICAIVGLIFCGFLELYPLIKGFSARKEAKATGAKVDGTLNAAWVISVIAVGLWLLMIILVAVTGSFSFHASTS